MRRLASPLSLALLLDECAYKITLHRLLEHAGIQVTTAAQAGLLGVDDEAVFAYARTHGLCILTKNPSDFLELHRATPDHPGVFLVYQDNDVTRDMTDIEIVRAIQNLIRSGVPVAGAVHALNHWRF